MRIPASATGSSLFLLLLVFRQWIWISLSPSCCVSGKPLAQAFTVIRDPSSSCKRTPIVFSSFLQRSMVPLTLRKRQRITSTIHPSHAMMKDDTSSNSFSSKGIPHASISSIINSDIEIVAKETEKFNNDHEAPLTSLQVLVEKVGQLQTLFGEDSVQLVSGKDPDWYDIPAINSLIFTISTTGNSIPKDYILVIIASHDRVDERSLEEAVNSVLLSNDEEADTLTEPAEKITTTTTTTTARWSVNLAPSSTVAEICGFPAGSIPPVGLSPAPRLTIIDRQLTQRQDALSLVRGGGGLPYQSCLVSVAMLAQQPHHYVSSIAIVKKKSTPDFPSKINGEVHVPVLPQPKPFFPIEPPNEALARAAVDSHDDSGIEQSPLQPVAVSVVGRIAGVRRMARRLAFCDLIPPTHSSSSSSSSSSSNNNNNDNVEEDLHAWRSAETNESMAVQLIAGKTLCENSNDDEEGDSIRRLQVGQLIWVEGRTNVQSPDSLRNWLVKKSLDIVVHSYQILQERNVAAEEAFAQARVQQKRERRQFLANPSNRKDEPPVDPATYLKLTDLYQHGTTCGTPSPILVDNMLAIKEFAKDLSQLLISLRKPTTAVDGEEKKIPLPLVGVDCEWQPNFLLASPRDPQPVQLLQICLHPLERVYLFDLKTLLRPMMPPSQSMDKLEKELAFTLGALFESKTLVKVGFQVVNDLRQLAASYPHMPSLQFYNAVLESSTLGRKAVRMLKHGNARECTSSLTRLVRHFLGRNLNKQEQCSDWALRPLTEAQMEYAALDAAVTPIVVETMLRKMHVQLFPEAILGRWPNDTSFKHSITSWRFVFVDATDPSAQRKLNAKAVVASELIVSQSWNTGYQVPPMLPTLPKNGNDGPYVDTSGVLQVPSPTVSIGTERASRLLQSMVGQIIGKSKDKCVYSFLHGSAALPDGARLQYSQRSGYVEFEDGVVLFVNMPSRARGQPRSYPNEWLDDGRVLTWFLRESDWQQGQSNLARKLAGTTSVVALFVRLSTTGSFLCCGRCRIEADGTSHCNNDEPVPDNWTLVELRLALLDWKRLMTCADFQSIATNRQEGAFEN